MSAWRKPLLYCSLAVAVFQIATFRDLYVPSHSAPSAEGVALLAAFGAACIAASLLVAWLAVRAGGLVCALLGLPLLAAGLSPNLLYWHDIAGRREAREPGAQLPADSGTEPHRGSTSPPRQLPRGTSVRSAQPDRQADLHAHDGAILCAPPRAHAPRLRRRKVARPRPPMPFRGRGPIRPRSRRFPRKSR